MRRRDLFRGIAGLAIAWPFPARGQQSQPKKVVTIGLLGSDTAQAQSAMVAAFVNRLHELGWSEGRNIVIEYRWAEGHTERLAALADELVRLNVNVILTHNTPPTLAAKKATSLIPVVFASAGDAVGSGIVESLARPGGNVTGLSSLQPETAGKRVELLHELLPDLATLAVLTDVGNPFAMRDIAEVQEAARHLGIAVLVFEIRQDQDIDRAFNSFRGGAQALYVPSVPLLFANRDRINELALAARLPTMHGVRELVQGGGLMSYGPNWPDMWRRAADLVDKILRGTNPGEIPVEQPTKFDLVISLTTARALGLTIPPPLLARADEVIE
jgi:putative tryptophan/tyrosine transport system substrate-binding protein